MCPDVYDAKEWAAKRSAYPWLTSNEKGMLLCSTCSAAGSLKVNSRQGVYVRTEWSEGGVSYSGNNKERQKTSLRRKIFDHKNCASHKTATKMLEEAKQDQLSETFLAQQKSSLNATCKLMRTAYSVAKHNRPYVSFSESIDLQIANGLEMGTCQHSRFAATAMIDCISDEMKAKLCRAIYSRSQKLSVMLDESTTVSRKSCMVVYIRTAWPEDTHGAECFSFPLGLVELESLKADYLIKSLLQLLTENGFDDEFLNTHLIGACSDGASVMLGRNSGVLTKLREKFPKLFLWHCMCHRLELAVGDAVNCVTQVSHVQAFLDKLYSVFSQSPKAQRELKECAAQVHCELLKVGRVLDVRWVASSYRGLLAIWKSYPALYRHSSESDSAKDSKHKSMFSGIKAVLASKQFVHNLAVLLDSLECISSLSQALQADKCTLGDAYQKLARTVRILELQKDGEMGDYFKIYSGCDGMFHGIELENRRAPFINKSAFYQALIDNLNSRMQSNVGFDDQDDFKSLLLESDIFEPSKWPSDVISPWLEGENRLKSFCGRFSIEDTSLVEDFRDFIDNPASLPQSIRKLKLILNTLPVTSADCERGFSSMNAICTDIRNSLTIPHVNALLFISLVGPPVMLFNPEPYAKIWLKSHRHSEFFRSKKQQSYHGERYEKLWGLF